MRWNHLHSAGKRGICFAHDSTERTLGSSEHVFSPNSCLQHGVLAVNLLIHQGNLVLPSSEEPHFCHTSAVPFKFSKQHFSESCCGCRETQNNVVRHSSRNHRCLKILLWQLPYSKWESAPSFFDPSYHQNLSKTIVIISILGLPLFCLGASASFFLQTRP